jgi:hypothetical protein
MDVDTGAVGDATQFRRIADRERTIFDFDQIGPLKLA